MENKKKPSEVETNEDHSSGAPSQSNRKMMLSKQNRFQPIGPNEIKKEGDIKQELLSVGELVEVSTSNYRNGRQVPGFNECDDEYDFDVLSLDEAKIEEKKESDDKEKEEPKRNADSEEEAEDGQQDEVDLMLAENDQNASVHNTPKRDDILKNSQKQHECNICGYSASYKSLLNRHMLKHTGEKPHGCDLCPKRFKSKQHLHSHMKVHVEEFLFHCP
ncbi:zinc finger protein 14 homolog, partial [Sitodiplosis mosellana]|uniref:zinc finger protein 14 homolog n=1 Tax=Sitodiplosis mosellana TaxID=263140 RepID=UPI002443C238